MSRNLASCVTISFRCSAHSLEIIILRISVFVNRKCKERKAPADKREPKDSILCFCKLIISRISVFVNIKPLRFALRTERVLIMALREENTRYPRISGVFLAERKRFELLIRYQRIHDFQSCALDQLSHLSTTFLL